jgi:large subunit ribosomal protein L17
MRHAKKFNHLGRRSEHRKAMLANMASSIIKHKRIFTTLAKAKAVRMYLEPLLTKGKNNTTHSRRTVFSYLKNKESIKELFDVIAPKIASRPGGYLRIIKTGFRPGDGAEMAMVELVDFNEVYTQAKADAGAKKKRSRRGTSKKAAAATDAPEAKEEAKVEAAPAEQEAPAVEETPATDEPAAEAEETKE